MFINDWCKSCFMFKRRSGVYFVYKNPSSLPLSLPSSTPAFFPSVFPTRPSVLSTKDTFPEGASVIRDEMLPSSPSISLTSDNGDSCQIAGTWLRSMAVPQLAWSPGCSTPVEFWSSRLLSITASKIQQLVAYRLSLSWSLPMAKS